MSSRLAVSSVNSSTLLPCITLLAEWLPSYLGDSVRGVESVLSIYLFPSYPIIQASFSYIRLRRIPRCNSWTCWEYSKGQERKENEERVRFLR